MSPSLLIGGGRLLDPSQGIDSVGDLLVAEGKIAWVGDKGTASPQPDSCTLDATGLIVCPGFIDLHCHLREPGFEDKETISTGTRAAARGGFTTVCCMANTNPPLDNQASIDYVKKTAQVAGAVRVLPIGCVTKGRQGKELTEMSELAEMGAIGFSDDGDSVASSRIMCLAMDYGRALDLPIIDHCEDKELASGGLMNEGWVSTRLGLKGIPAAAEEIIVARDLALAQLTGARLHIAHVSTRGSVELIRRAKEKGIAVTAEVTPHHLTLSEERVMGWQAGKNDPLTYDTNAKVNPPLRSEEDIAALIEGLRDGVIDSIATDHAPHTLADKMCEFGFAAFGISGFETALGCLMGLVHSGELDLVMLVSKLTLEPARIIGSRYGELGTLKPGCEADITLFDPDKEWVVSSQDFLSKGKNTPFDGCQFKGKVAATIAGGDVVYQDDPIRIEKK
ncbi:MAG: dihydroorotase [Dehalococcoidia bacterium]|nr:dihydroorotase [Dehalococcoidia bacterium]